jgi:DivIVA domain-containing protein
MNDFERSGTTYDEPVKRRSPGSWFADLGERLARGRPGYDQLQGDEPEWEAYEDLEQPTAAVDPIAWDPARKRFPTALHGYDREAVDAHLAALEREMGELRAQRSPVPAVEAEIERVGEETSAILRVAHEQAAEITRRAQSQADRCIADAAGNAVAMTEDAKRKLRQLDSETDAVWAERGRLIEDARNVATALFSLAEDAADRFPEDGDRGAPAAVGTATAPSSAPAPIRAAPPDTSAMRATAAPPGSAGPPPMPWMPAASERARDGEPSERRPD